MKSLIKLLIIPLLLSSCNNKVQRVPSFIESQSPKKYLILSLENGCDDCNMKIFNFVKTRQKEILRNEQFEVVFSDVKGDKLQRRNFDFDIVQKFRVDSLNKLREQNIIEFYPVFIEVEDNVIKKSLTIQPEELTWSLAYMENKLNLN